MHFPAEALLDRCVDFWALRTLAADQLTDHACRHRSYVCGQGMRAGLGERVECSWRVEVTLWGDGRGCECCRLQEESRRGVSAETGGGGRSGE